MKNRQNVPTRPATPDEVLRVLVEETRVRYALDPFTDEIEVTGDTTVRAWRDSLDLIPLGISSRLLHGSNAAWSPLLNRWFGVALSEADYVEALTPERKRTLGDLCDLVAPHMRVPEVKPMRFGGSPCLPAGAFFALRAVLTERGVLASGAKPSLSLALLSDEQKAGFHSCVAQFAPGLLEVRPWWVRARPQSSVGQKLFATPTLALVIGVVALALGLVTFHGWLVLGGLFLAPAGWIGRQLWSPPDESDVSPFVWAERFETLGNLARAIANAS